MKCTNTVKNQLKNFQQTRFQKKTNKTRTYVKKGGKFLPKMNLKQPGFTYSTCVPFTKNKE